MNHELLALTGRVLYNKEKLIELINELNRKVYTNSQNENAEYFSYQVEFVNDGKEKKAIQSRMKGKSNKKLRILIVDIYF